MPTQIQGQRWANSQSLFGPELPPGIDDHASTEETVKSEARSVPCRHGIGKRLTEPDFVAVGALNHKVDRDF